MSLSPEFKEAAETYQGNLDADLVEPLKQRGWVFTFFTGQNYDTPNAIWEDFCEKLGGEDAVDGVFDGEMFDVTHKASGKTASGNGAVDTFASLWLAVNA